MKTPEFNNKIPKKESRRKFLKKGLAILASAALTPKETFGQVAGTAEKEKPIIDIVVEGERVVWRPSDITLFETIYSRYRENFEKTMQESFDAEIQKAIVEHMGEKLTAGLLKAQEHGFKFSSRDTAHAHLLVEKGFLDTMLKKYPRNFALAKTVTKEDVLALPKKVKALIFHCLEFPTPEQINEKFFKETYPHRSIVVNEQGHAFNAKPTKTKSRARSTGDLFPNFGVRQEDYNDLEKTDYVDLARGENVGGSSFHTDIQFIPVSEKEEGVKLDPGLPPFKLVFSFYKKESPETKK